MKISQVSAGVTQANKPASMKVIQPDGHFYKSSKGEPCTLLFVGTDSDRFRETREEVQRRNLAEQKEEIDVTKDTIRNREDLSVGAIVGWSGWEDDDDNELPCTPENVRALLKADHILQQVWKNIFAHRSFFSDSSPA